MIIRAKAPLRLGFAGGGTDVSPYSDEYGGLVLNATINKYAYTSLVPVKESQIIIESLDFNSKCLYDANEILEFNGEMDLAKGVIRRLKRNGDGVYIYTHNDAPPGSGLGSSSAMVVSLIGAFREWKMLPMGDYEIAQLAYDIERRDIRLNGGKQDQYAATFGGFNMMEFYGDQVIINPLRIKADILNELEYNLILCFTGGTRLSGRIIDAQVENYKKGKSSSVDAMNELKQQAMDMKVALLRNNLKEFGNLLNVGWDAKKKMADGITNPVIDELYSEAIRTGAVGAKISGAGGGGFMMIYCDYSKKHRVAERLESLGGTVVDFQFERKGLQSWRS